jgi:2-isopropylmalate synthase
MNAARESLIADWNRACAPVAPSAKISVHDETLRDGLQSVSVAQPSLDDKLELLNLMAGVGVDTACLGMPVTSATAQAHVLRLVAEIAAGRLDVGATCAARTTPADIGVVADIAQETGMAMSVMAFIGISRIRMLSEGWSVESVTAAARDAVAFARREGIGICIVTEDTTRTSLDVTIDVYAAALEAGADRICVCDTVGYATPWSAAALVSQLRLGLARRGFPEVGIDWHGHNDRGLALANALAAASAGADRLHGTALGIGERAGNTAIEQLLPNLRDLGWRDGDLALLPRYCEQASRSCGVGIPGTQPFAGQDVFSSMAGVHASAIRKAEQIGGGWLAERVYSGIPAAAVGRAQNIEIGPASGRANILAWLGVHGIPPVPALVDQIRRAAADAGQVLTDQQLMAIVSAARWQEVLPRIGTGKALQDRYAKPIPLPRLGRTKVSGTR